jgi:hypothetical protein
MIRSRFTAALSACTLICGLTVARAADPLRVHPDNPRYFTDGTKHSDGSLRAVYLTGSHTWNNLIDIGPGDPPPAFDYPAYLDFLAKHHHNFFRLWSPEEAIIYDQMHHVGPQPWSRPGPGTAIDGEPKFDLSKLNQAYFDRMRQRVQAAGQRGIYVAIMFFEGWTIGNKADRFKYHPFHKDNNVNGIDGDPNGDGRGREVHSLEIPAITRLQEAYVRRVIETVGDLDNVLYEIANESGTYSTEWQYHLIRFVKSTEAGRPKQHPVGMTFQYAGNSKHRGTNSVLIDSPADWISPNKEAGEWNYQDNPPPADGRKVILSDTDHLGGIWGNVPWVWKSFTRGHNPIFMDPYDGGVLDGGKLTKWEPVRMNLGLANQLAARMNLAAMTPDVKLASTGYCLVSAGKEYLIYLPEGGEVSVDLSAAKGTLAVEWFNPRTAEKKTAENAVGGARRTFQVPFKGDAVLHLKAP